MSILEKSIEVASTKLKAYNLWYILKLTLSAAIGGFLFGFNFLFIFVLAMIQG